MDSSSIKSILLLDTNIASKGIYDYLNSLGYVIYVIGNNPSDYLAKICPNYIEANYSDVELIRDLVEDIKCQYIIPGCNDKSYSIASILSDIKSNRTVIEKPEIDQLLNNKSNFKEYCKKNNIPTSKRLTQISLSDLGSINDVIIKPVDSFSGKGVSKILKQNLNSQSLKLAIEKAEKNSSNSKFIIEEFIEGQLYSHSCFINSKQEIIKDFIVEEHCIDNEFAVDHSFVITKPKQEILQIRNYIRRLARDLNLKEGLIHTQFILSKNENIPFVIEITRRCPGDMYYKLIEESTGFSYSAMYVNGFIENNNCFKKIQYMDLTKFKKVAAKAERRRRGAS